MVGTGSPVSFRRRPPLASRSGPDCQSSATAFTPVWAHVSAWGPARHDNHEGQRMTPGAPTDGARSRFPGHRGSTEAGTALKDSATRRRSSKGVHCGSPLIVEARVGHCPCVSSCASAVARGSLTHASPNCARPRAFRERGEARKACACGPLPHGRDAQPHPITVDDPIDRGGVSPPPYQPRPRQSRRPARRSSRPRPCGRGSVGSPPPQGLRAPGSLPPLLPRRCTPTRCG